VQNSYYARGLVCYMWVSCFMCVSCLLHVLHHVMSMPGRRNVCVGASRAVYLFCKVCAAGNLAEFWRKSQGTEWYNQHPVVASQPNPNLRIPIGQHGDDAGVYNNEKFPGKHFFLLNAIYISHLWNKQSNIRCLSWDQILTMPAQSLDSKWTLVFEHNAHSQIVCFRTF